MAKKKLTPEQEAALESAEKRMGEMQQLAVDSAVMYGKELAAELNKADEVTEDEMAAWARLAIHRMHPNARHAMLTAYTCAPASWPEDAQQAVGIFTYTELLTGAAVFCVDLRLLSKGGMAVIDIGTAAHGNGNGNGSIK